MRKYLVTLFLMCMAVSAFAVDLPKQGFGVQIGWAQPILRLNDPSNPSTAKDSLSNITKLKGFKVGIVYDGSFIAGFGTSIGINYTFGATSTAWTKKFPNQPTLYPQVHDKVLYHELELFVDWQYKFEVAKETYLMLYTGPTIQCGVGFYSQRDERSIDGTLIPAIAASDRYKTDDADLLLKRLNITWGIGAGFQYQRYFLRGGYDFGLINPYKNQDFENGNHTRGRLDQWSIKIGAYIWYED